MAGITRDQTAEGWDSTAEAYANVVANVTAQYVAEGLEPAAIRAGERVVDIGAGTGAASLILAEMGAHVLATDFSPQMLDILNARLQADGIRGIETAVMDGQALDLADGTFDAAVSFFGLIFFPDRAAGFSEMHRVLKPGGRAVVGGWADASHVPQLGIWGEAMRRAVPDMPAPSQPPPVFSLSDPAAFRSEMEAAGFVDVSITPVDREVRFADTPEDYWKSWSIAAPVFSAVLEAKPDMAELVHQALIEVLHERVGAGPVVLPQRALIGTGWKR